MAGETRSGWFGEVRAQAERAPDRDGWRRLTALADDAVQRFGAEQAAEIALPYLEPLAARWPDEERAAPRAWTLARGRGAPCVMWPLARAAWVIQEGSYQGPSYHGAGQVFAGEVDPTLLEGLTWIVAHAGRASHITLWEELPSSVTGLNLNVLGHLRPLTERGWWERISALSLHNGGAGWRVVRGLLDESLALGHIKRLELGHDQLVADELGWLLEQTALEALALRDMKTISDDVALRIATSERLRRLRELRLERVNMSAHALWVIGASEALGGLERLVCDNREASYWPLEARALVRDLRLFELRELAMLGCGLRSACVDALERVAPQLKRLERLDVSANTKLFPGELKRLRAAYPAAQVISAGSWGEKMLRGDGTAIKVEAGEASPPRLFYKLFEDQPPAAWTSISLSASGTADVYLEPLLEGRFERLKQLELESGYNTKPYLGVGVPHMLINGQLPALEVLKLVGAPLSLTLARGRWPRGLRRVELRGAKLDDRDAATLCEALPSGLEVLDLSYNYLTYEAIEALRGSFREVELKVEGNLGARLVPGGAVTLESDDVYHAKEVEAQLRSRVWATIKRVTIKFMGKAYGDDWPEEHGLRFVGRHDGLADLEELCVDGGSGYVLGTHEEWLDALLKHLPSRLKRLELPGGFRAHESHPMRLASRLRHWELEVLDLRRNDLSDMRVLEALSANDGLPKLREVVVREGNSFDEQALRRLELRWAGVRLT